VITPLYKVKAGDTPADWFAQIQQRIGFVADEYWDTTAKKWKARLFHPSDMPKNADGSYQTPRKIFYTDSVTRLAVAGTDDQIIWQWSERGLPPECNQFAIDYCTAQGEHVMLIVDDEDSQNPTTPVIDRPRNWIGEIKCGMMRSDNLRKHAYAYATMSAMIDRPGVMGAMRSASFVAEFDPTVQQNTLITIVDAFRGVDVYRVMQVADINIVNNNGIFYHRPTTYVIEREDK
jgi:hypothetical protein